MAVMARTTACYRCVLVITVIFWVTAMLAAPASAQPSAAITTFGGDGDGATDTSAAFRAAIENCRQTGCREITFPKGKFLFLSPPEPMTFGVTLRGASKSDTELIRGYSGGDFLVWRGGEPPGGGMSGGAEKIAIIAAAGTSGGTGIKLMGDARGRASFNHFQDIIVTGRGTWAFTVMIDGSNLGAPLQGIRDVSFVNVSLFNATVSPLYIYNGVAITFVGGGIFQGFGTTADVYILGWPGDPSRWSTKVTMQTFVDGTLFLCNATVVTAIGSFGGLFAGCGGGHSVVIGHISGTVNNQLDTVRIISASGE